jgi:hypothetical protein
VKCHVENDVNFTILGATDSQNIYEPEKSYVQFDELFNFHSYDMDFAAAPDG